MSRYDRCTLEQILQIVIMVGVEPANGDLLVRPSELSFDMAIVGAAVRFNSQTTEGP